MSHSDIWGHHTQKPSWATGQCWGAGAWWRGAGEAHTQKGPRSRVMEDESVRGSRGEACAT